MVNPTNPFNLPLFYGNVSSPAWGIITTRLCKYSSPELMLFGPDLIDKYVLLVEGVVEGEKFVSGDFTMYLSVVPGGFHCKDVIVGCFVNNGNEKL